MGANNIFQDGEDETSQGENETPATLAIVTQRFDQLDLEEFRRVRAVEIARQEQMKQEWSVLTGESMNSKDFQRFLSDWARVNSTRMTSNIFERLKTHWTLLTKTTDPTDLEQKIHDMTPDELKNLKRDYLVLNWAKMSDEDFEKFKNNWSVVARMTGAEEDNIIKHWLLHGVAYMEYRYMSYEDKVLFTRMCLDRGADVNAVNSGGYSLLHMMMGDGLMLHPPLIEVLLSYGADVMHRQRTGETPLEDIRTYYYKDHEDIVRMLQIAEKGVRKNALQKSTTNEAMLQLIPNLNEREIETIEPPYLKKKCELFDLVDLSEIDELTLSVINYMYVSKIEKTELKFNHRDRSEKIAKTHRVFSKMCSKLFNVFDPEFTKAVNVYFSPGTHLSDSADLVFLMEIDPNVEWVCLKLYAVPWDIEYFLNCKASSKSRFSLGRNSRSDLSICSENLICDYSNYLGAFQRHLDQRFLNI